MVKVLSSDKANKIENVLMVVIDCLRADHLRCYGYPIQTAASIDAWADVSNQFLFAEGHCRTLYSIATLITGRRNFSTSEKNINIDETNGLLWQVLEGMDCFCYSPNTIVTSLFERSDWDVQGTDKDDSWLAKALTDRAIERIAELEELRISRKAFRNENGWFGILWYGDVHAYQTFYPVNRVFVRMSDQNLPSPDTEWGARIRQYLYDMTITHVDLELRRLWKAIQVDNTAIIITADHGEMLSPIFKHTISLVPEILRVPLIISIPGQRLMNRVWTQRVSWLDLPPTIAKMLGRDIPSQWDGEELFTMMTAKIHRPDIAAKLKELGYIG